MAGNLKMTLPAAFSTALLAWGLLSFPAGYAKQTGATAYTAQQVEWGADYLLKTISPASGGGYNLVYQVDTERSQSTGHELPQEQDATSS